MGLQTLAFDISGSQVVVTRPNSSELGQLSLKHFADEPFMRNFIVSSAEVFVLAQKQFKSCYPDPVPQTTITALSQMYRGIILELVQNLKDVGDLETASLYSNLDFVWNFCEIIFLSSNPDLPVLPYLIDWVRINFDQSSKILPEVQQELPDLGQQCIDKVWKLIYTHVFHGRTREAAKLLPFVNPRHGNSNSNGTGSSASLKNKIDLMTELLEKKPRYNPRTGSFTDFESSWESWREECVNRLDQRVFYGNEQLTFICHVLCGNDEGFIEARSKNLLTWYEYLVMLINYRFPVVRPSALKGYARKVVTEFGLGDSLEPRDIILFHAMEYDIVNVLKEIQTVWNNPWYSIHFVDLIFAGGKFSEVTDVRIDYSSVPPLRAHFIIDYGTTIMEHKPIWQIGVPYFEALEEPLRRQLIGKCIERINPKTEMEAQKLVQIAGKFNLADELHGICRKVAVDKLQCGQMQNALLWAIKAGDNPLTTHIVDQILFEGDCQIEPSLLESLRNAIPCSDRLVFLSGFCDFRKLMDKHDYPNAVGKLCQLIKEDMIPKRIHHKIIQHLITLAEKNVKFRANETTILMEFVHMQVGLSKITPEDFTRLNVLLVCNRAQEILTMFNNKPFKQ
ncbi:unnamed protein product [Orchesella dallaii]|uniref:Nuclear pore complex protein Nup85 n=1 Tax=Orchesella dallaii TaxID=48710 RepID=A0ABP1PRE6_9HEXA